MPSVFANCAERRAADRHVARRRFGFRTEPHHRRLRRTAGGGVGRARAPPLARLAVGLRLVQLRPELSVRASDDQCVDGSELLSCALQLETILEQRAQHQLPAAWLALFLGLEGIAKALAAFGLRDHVEMIGAIQSGPPVIWKSCSWYAFRTTSSRSRWSR